MLWTTNRLWCLVTAALLLGSHSTRDASAERNAPTSINHNDPNLHLFVDDEEIESAENLERVINRPRKHPSPVIVADRPWEGDRAQAWGNVILEPDGLLRIFYFAMNTERRPEEGLDRGGYAYAESRDGIHWEKPSLGVVEFRGSKDNNLFYTCAPDGKNLVDVELARRGLGLPAIDQNGEQIGVLNNLDGIGAVVRDDDEPDPEKRYKLIANMQDHRMWAWHNRDRYPNVTQEQYHQAQAVFGQYLDTSPDGIHWNRRPHRVLSAVGDYMMVTRDYRNNRWWLNERAHGRGGRNAALRTSKDLIQWTDPMVVFDNEADSDYGKKFEWHGGITPFNYGNVNLGFLEKWPTGDFGATCELVSNRDGGPWKRVAPGESFLDVDPEGSFDRVLIYPTHNPPIRIGDQLYIFYTGGGVKTNPKKGVPMAIGVATIGLDRFAAMANWRGNQGLLVTKPTEVTGSHLQINAEFLEAVPIQVALSSADGTMLPGYGFEECQMDIEPTAIYTPVRWKDKADLSELRGQPIKLHFKFKGAALYGYRITD